MGRLNLNYKIGTADIAINHNLTSERRTGEDEFGIRVPIEGERVDPFNFPAIYEKNITGLQITFPYLKEKITQVFTAKRYAVNTQSLNQFSEQDITPELADETFGVGTSIKYGFDKDRFLRISYENATRIPDRVEYLGDGILAIGNNNLEPEQSHNINLGFYLHLDRDKNWWLDVNTFYRYVRDMIIPQLVQINFVQYQNQNNARIFGLEANIKTTPFKNLEINANITYQDVRRVNIEENTERSLEGARLPQQPYFFTNLNVGYGWNGLFKENDDLSLYGNYSFVEYIFRQIPRSQEPRLFENVSASTLTNLERSLVPTQHLLNIGVSYKLAKTPLWFNLEINNMLNGQLFDNFRIPKQPLNFNFKIRYQLN